MLHATWDGAGSTAAPRLLQQQCLGVRRGTQQVLNGIARCAQ
jgi:hypothetical protein